ncbi:hypothetical protein BH10PSE17_BH10PSE17_13250 [soil metagenome]
MSHSRRVGLLAALTLAASAPLAPAWAQAAPDPNARSYFTCKDSSGHVLTSDRWINECSDREQREYNANGTLRRVIEAPLTPEQRRVREADDKKKAAAELAALERRRLDRVLLSSYSNVSSIDAARERALGEPLSGIAKSNERLATLKKDRQALQADTEFYKNKPLPHELEARIKDNDAQQLYEQGLIDRRNAEIVRINERYDADRVRFLELTGSDGKSAP